MEIVLSARFFSFVKIAIFGLISIALLPHASAVTIDTVLVGNPNNPANEADLTGLGAVSYEYRIGKYEVTNAQYVEFLNAVAQDDPNGLFNVEMESTTQGGIVRTGSAGSYSYSVKPTANGAGPGGSDYDYANKPVVFVSWYDSLRFVNWLHNGQPTGIQDASTTEEGAYMFSGPNLVGARNAGATWVLPNENEWYKAAYHKNDGVTANYWAYPAGTDLFTSPNNNLPSSDTGNSANFEHAVGDSDYPLTDVGAYMLSASPYGTFDQGGNVFEWNETVQNSSFDGINLRGGSWQAGRDYLRSDYSWGPNGGSGEFATAGFRVASVPEPSGIVLGTLACAALLQIGMSIQRRRQ